MSESNFFKPLFENQKDEILLGIRNELEELKQSYQPKEPKRYLTRQEVAEMLSVDLSTIHNWSERKILTRHSIGRRVYYLRDEVEEAIIKTG